MDDKATKPSTLYAILGLVVTLLCAPSVLKAIVNNYKLSSIPTVGSSGFLTSYIGALRFFRHAPAIMQEGYEKYRGSMFKVPMMSKWWIVVCGPRMIDEIRWASDEQLSAAEGFRENFHTDLTLGPELFEKRYHVDVVKVPLTKNIVTKFPEIHDEVQTAFEDHIQAKGGDWVTITPHAVILDIVARASNRMFVGLPLCRDPAYLKLNKQFAKSLVTAAQVLNAVPFFLRSTVARLLPQVPRDIECGFKHLVPLFKERLEQDARYGRHWPERPDDAISWVIDYSDQEQSYDRRMRGMVLSMLQINFSSVHTTTTTFTHVLLNLATHPEYVQPMRGEVEAVVCRDGWSKAAVGKLRKVDSFIKESLRLSGFPPLVMKRKVLKDFTFSNGLTVPAGNTLAVATAPTHIDPENYLDADTFDGFRFEKMRDEKGMEYRHQIVSIDLTYLLFANGRHACPGRFLAANELKIMLAHVLLNYDVKLASGSGRPDNLVFGPSTLPDPTAQVMFRRRE